MNFNELRMLKHMLEHDGMRFYRYFFKTIEGNLLLRNWHHYVIDYLLQRVLNGGVSRLIVNIGPGYGKTTQCVINFVARALALYPRAKFITASYGAHLAHESSIKIRSIINSSEYQQLWPTVIQQDARSKGKWYTEYGGGLLATATGGQITGFRAGRMESGFTGAVIIDDPVKPEEANSHARRNRINARFMSTFRSRLATDDVPIFIIMQRIHPDDMTGFLLKGGADCKWSHICIPSLLTNQSLSKEYPSEYTHGDPIKIVDILQCLAVKT